MTEPRKLTRQCDEPTLSYNAVAVGVPFATVGVDEIDVNFFNLLRLLGLDETEELRDGDERVHDKDDLEVEKCL